jgi:WD40 repeat protein
VWDLAHTNGPSRVLLEHSGPLSDFALSPDGKRLAGVSWDFTAFLAELSTGRLLAPPLRHEEMIVQVSFSRDGDAFVTSGFDAVARLWDGFTGRTLTAPLRHEQLVNRAEFSPDGQRVVTASMDRSVRVWDRPTGLPIGPPLLHPAFVGSARFSPDSQRIVTTCGDGNARVWDLPAPAQPPPDWLPALAEALAGQRIDDAGVMRDTPWTEFAGLRQRLAADRGTNLWSRWGRWFAADRSVRPRSPFAQPAR